ncbi:hypothetical protein [Robiginitomaculum antarcticum]|uniref:hypothetical protein n=1 Tax=Robiginitomaculum antarcticum TaxID=437507 RepID=UPI0003829A94|nr:hypothetical protein [Robiginitomaculum antarcticum]
MRAGLVGGGAPQKKQEACGAAAPKAAKGFSSVYEDAIPAAISHGRYAALAKVTVHSAVCSQTRLM